MRSERKVGLGRPGLRHLNAIIFAVRLLFVFSSRILRKICSSSSGFIKQKRIAFNPFASVIIKNCFKDIKNERIQLSVCILFILIYDPFLLVLIPKGKYSGQKLIKLTITNIPANTSNTIPNMPVMIFVKNKTAITTATSILITLSTVPMFFFIILCF